MSSLSYGTYVPYEEPRTSYFLSAVHRFYVPYSSCLQKTWGQLLGTHLSEQGSILLAAN